VICSLIRCADGDYLGLEVLRKTVRQATNALQDYLEDLARRKLISQTDLYGPNAIVVDDSDNDGREVAHV